MEAPSIFDSDQAVIETTLRHFFHTRVVIVLMVEVRNECFPNEFEPKCGIVPR